MINLLLLFVFEEFNVDGDFGIIVIRLALGVMLLLHGLNKAVGPGRFAGTEGWFESLGLRPAWLHARVAAATEVGAGGLMMLGLATPLAATAFVGLMLVATWTDHRGKGYFVFKGGWEYAVLVALVAIGVAATGPGEWSLDHALGWESGGIGWAATASGGGLLAALGLLATCYRPTGRFEGSSKRRLNQ